MNTDCKTEEGITVGLIDAMMSIARVLRDRELHSEVVQEALQDIRDDDDMHWLMNMGDLDSCEEYIAYQRKQMEGIMSCVEKYKELLEKAQGKEGPTA